VIFSAADVGPSGTPPKKKTAIKGFVVGLAAGLGFVIGALALSLMTAGQIYDYRETVRITDANLPEVDVIIALAGGKSRIAGAGDLWLAYYKKAVENPGTRKVPVLYLSGVGQKADYPAIVKRMRPEVREVLKKSSVFLETKSENTIENALYFKAYADKWGWKRAVLTTAAYHMRRSLLIFEKVLGPSVRLEVATLPADLLEQGGFTLGEYSNRVTLIEYFKWLYYRFWFDFPT
jgi:uncharacterized SAM-binding protein YcdF (DUF218 family)